jgi:hypothetical protein
MRILAGKPVDRGQEHLAHPAASRSDLLDVSPGSIQRLAQALQD